MSIMPEYVLQQVLVRGLRAIRKDERIIGALFRNLQQSELQALVRFFQDNSIDLSLNYPDQNLKLPAIVILLKGEAESDAFLGDLMQSYTSLRELGTPYHIEEVAGDATIVGRGTTARATAPNLRTQMSAITAAAGTASTVEVPAGLFTLFDPFEEETFVTILEGTGAGQTRQVVSVDPGSDGANAVLTVTPTWTPPDATSVIKFVSDPSDISGEPPKLFKAGDVVDRIGAHYKANYQIICLGPNPEVTIYLYNIVKSMIFLNMQFLVTNGFLNPKMSGSDFMPRAEYLPDLAYNRSLLLEFDYSFDVYIPSDDTILDQLVVSVTVHDPDVEDGEDLERIALETTIDLDASAP